MKQFALFFFIFFSSLYARENEFVPKNEVIVCDNGLEMLSWQLDFMREAKQSIEAALCFAGGSVFQDILDVMEERLQKVPTLQIFVLLSPTFFTPEDKKRVQRLVKSYPYNFRVAYATCVATLTPDISAYDNHIKMVVVDETYFTAGGTNVHEALCSEGTYTPPSRDFGNSMANMMGAGARDQDIVGRGEIAKQLRKIFYPNFCIWEKFNQTGRIKIETSHFENCSYFQPLKQESPPFVSRFETSKEKIPLEEGQIELFFGGPHLSKKGWEHNPISKEYVKLIDGAQKEILIGNLYICPIQPIQDALLRAVNRGVKLIVISNGVNENSPSFNDFFCWANRVSVAPLFYGRTFHLHEKKEALSCPIKNTRVFEYNVHNMLYHKKVMIVDKKYLVIGSYNLGIKSHHYDYELVLKLENPNVIRQALKVYLKDVRCSLEVSPEQAHYWYFDPILSFKGESQKRIHALL